MANREKIAGFMPSENQSRSAKANAVIRPIYGNNNPGAFVAFGFSDPFALCRQRKGSLDAAQHDVGSFVKRSW
jgi:hypothetical protein